MPLDGALLVALHLDPVQLFARPEVPNLEAEEIVDIDEAEGLAAVHCEGTHGSAEWAHGPGDGVGPRVRDGE